jgi:hypothetical protein
MKKVTEGWNGKSEKVLPELLREEPLGKNEDLILIG